MKTSSFFWIRVKELMESRRLSISMLALLLDIHPKTLRKWIFWSNVPDDLCIYRIANIFGVSRKHLICEKGDLKATISKCQEQITQPEEAPYHSPAKMISGSKSNPLSSFTRRIISSIKKRMSFEHASPVLMIMLPCQEESWAPPLLRPRRPRSAMIFPAGAPKAGLFLKTDPAEG
jgi:hypothetical protein